MRVAPTLPLPPHPRNQPPAPWPSRRYPGKPHRAAAAKAKAGGGTREKPASRARPLTRAPGSCPRPSGARLGAPRRRPAGCGGGAGSQRVRPGVRSAGFSRCHFGAGSPPRAPHRLLGGGRPASGQWGPRGRASPVAHPPPKCTGGAAGSAQRSRLLPGRSRLAGALYRAHPRTHLRLLRGRPTCDTPLFCPFWLNVKRNVTPGVMNVQCECEPGTVLSTQKSESKQFCLFFFLSTCPRET